VHGSGHAAWCWEEHFLPFFAARGFDAYALSLRAQGGSAGGRDGVAGTLSSHAADVADFAATLHAPAVVIGHSFGGLVVQEMLGRPPSSSPSFAGAVLACSVPPAGNSGIASRMLKATPLRALRITWSFISRGYASDAQLCRGTFFSATLPQEKLLVYMASIAGSGTTRLLDLSKLSASLPVPPQAPPGVPVLVMGGADDAVVDVEGVKETAAVWGVPPVLLPRLAHDLMLDTEWRSAAEALAGWLDEKAL
jgi:pimeloyl-ACP methyl ester carboxylesterase